MNNKGFTLIELLGVMVILGMVMAVIIPNVSGISTQNKITTYAEDAKKFKSTVEYMLRGDDTVLKPKINNHCVLVDLKYVHGSEYDNPPYGGEYLMDKSFVLMTKVNNRYVYFIQLIEKYNSDGTYYYKGFKLMEYSNLESTNYLNWLTESTSSSSFVDVNPRDNRTDLQNGIRTGTSSKCLYIDEVYLGADV